MCVVRAGPLGDDEVLDINMREAVVFVVVASATLLVLFYFLNKAFFYVLVSCLHCSFRLLHWLLLRF
jgi:hypothetical protein